MRVLATLGRALRALCTARWVPLLANQRGSITIDSAFIHAVDDNIAVLAQQQVAKCSGADCIRREDGVTGVTKDFERIGPIEMVNLTARHQDTPLVDTPHSRRRAFFTDAAIADLVDDVDKVKMLIDAQSAYAQNFARSRNRKMDRIVIAAFNAAATNMSAADSVSSTTALPAAQAIANGGTNLTMAKVNSVVDIFNSQDVDPDDRYFVYSSAGMKKLLGDSTVTSSDFSTIQALTRGVFPMDATWMGMKWRLSTLLPKVANIRSCFAWQKNAMGLAVGLLSAIEIDKRADKNNSTQVLLKLSAGAVRIDDAGVVQVDIDESA